MRIAAAKKIVLLGMMTGMPVGGNLWLILHYLIGLRRLGYAPYYVEAHGIPPTKLMRPGEPDGSDRAAAFIARLMARFDLNHHWAYHARHADNRVYGLSEGDLQKLYRAAELIINVHGGTRPLPEHHATGRLAYLETDPVDLELRLHGAPEAARDFAAPYAAMFTWAENYGSADCQVPIPEAFEMHPTRPPVLLDLWRSIEPAGEVFTTVGNWRQAGSRALNNEVYRWSKHYEFRKFLDLPARTGLRFELALSAKSMRQGDRELLEGSGWMVRDALGFSRDLDRYRRYIQQSRGEFTVAKDQNVRLRSGWFSERSATYLAAGRPVVMQDTGFGKALPTGEGLFAFATTADVEHALERINSDYQCHSRAATEIARSFFNYDVVLPRLLADAGVSPAHVQPRMAAGLAADRRPAARATASVPSRTRHAAPLGPHSRVAALIPHHRCEQWLPDCLESLVRQTRPLDAIVVIDDASDAPPVEIVRRFPQATLLVAADNVGPYRLIQQVMDDTGYDAYLFQDSDDWSAPDRLEVLLYEAARTGAELIGGQEVRVRCMEAEVLPFARPLDGNAALAADPAAFPLLHPTTLVCRDLVMRLGGFSTGMRFGGDAEFLRRAAFVARVVNAPHYHYFRRIRPGSLTMAPDTGFKSPVRRALIKELRARGEANAIAVREGRQPNLAPYATAPPVHLEHVIGPRLLPAPAVGLTVVAPTHLAGLATEGTR